MFTSTRKHWARHVQVCCRIQRITHCGTEDNAAGAPQRAPARAAVHWQSARQRQAGRHTAAPPRAGDGLGDGAAGTGGEAGGGAADEALDEEALPSTLFFGVRGEQARAGLRSHARQAGR